MQFKRILNITSLLLGIATASRPHFGPFIIDGKEWFHYDVMAFQPSDVFTVLVHRYAGNCSVDETEIAPPVLLPALPHCVNWPGEPASAGHVLQWVTPEGFEDVDPAEHYGDCIMFLFDDPDCNSDNVHWIFPANNMTNLDRCFYDGPFQTYQSFNLTCGMPFSSRAVLSSSA